MKNSVFVLGSTIFFTLIFYLLAYYFLPPPPPSAAVMVLFAAIAGVLVWTLQWGFRKARSKKTDHLLLLLSVSCFLVICQTTEAAVGHCRLTQGPRAGEIIDSHGLPIGSPCDDGAGSTGYVVASASPSPPSAHAPSRAPSAVDRAPASEAPAAAAPAASADAAIAADQASTGSATMPRVTGTAVLLPQQKEEPGFGLYSYALLTHAPLDSELPKYRAFLKALVELPTAQDLGGYLPKIRINITYLPLTSSAQGWNIFTTNQKVDYVLSHYDYARGAAMLASLPERTGVGPVLTSVLTPLSFDRLPHPVLVQDMSTAQPVLMEDYVKEFVDQAAKDHFWEAKTLAAFSLGLQNALQTAAVGLGMSQDAVKNWIHYFK